VVPPSVVRGGKGYRWLPGQELDVLSDRLPIPPAWLIEELDRLAAPAPAPPPAADMGANQIPVGQRNATLARRARAMPRGGLPRAELAAAILQANRARCAPPLAPREVERIATSVARYEPDQIAVAMAENHWDQMYADTPEEEIDTADPGPVPED